MPIPKSNAESIEDAVKLALAFIQRVYKDDDLQGLMLEEISEKDEHTWEVTLGFSRAAENQAPLRSISPGGPTLERVYKTLAVNKHTGHVGSMTIRTV